MLTPRCCRLTWNARPSCARPVPHHVPRTRDLLLLLTPFPCSRGPGLEPASVHFDHPAAVWPSALPEQPLPCC